MFYFGSCLFLPSCILCSLQNPRGWRQCAHPSPFNLVAVSCPTCSSLAIPFPPFRIKTGGRVRTSAEQLALCLLSVPRGTGGDWLGLHAVFLCLSESWCNPGREGKTWHLGFTAGPRQSSRHSPSTQHLWN